MISKLHGLYPVSESSLIYYDSLPSALELMFEGGVTIFQLRDKSQDKSHLLSVCKEIRRICNQYGALFIIDDDVEFAINIDADGVHLGEHDMTIEMARAKLGNGKIIGASCYGSIERALQMQAAGADYAAFGAFFASKTKPLAPTVERGILEEAKKALNIPICAIGGITDTNASELTSKGADMVAVITDIWQCDDLHEKIINYKRYFNDK
jgi:thiamine-phosphate pyrophosphorylase